MSVELYNKIHELELRCKELTTERDAIKEAHRILNNWRNDNLSKVNNYDQLEKKIELVLKCHQVKNIEDILCADCVGESKENKLYVDCVKERGT
jgi:hypothetical protein